MLKLNNIGIVVDPPSGPFPFGALINSNPLGSGNGSAAVAEWANDPIQAIYAVLDHFGIVANDISEQVGNSDLVRIFQNVLPVGSFIPVAYTTDPATLNVRALPCEGQVVSRTTYADLFAAIGTVFNTGGEAGTDFRLPETRGEAIRGFDNGRGIDAARVFGTYQLDQFQGHAHETGAFVNLAGFQLAGSHSTRSWTIAQATVADTASTSANAIANGIDGAPREGGETRMRNFTARFLIRY